MKTQVVRRLRQIGLTCIFLFTIHSLSATGGEIPDALQGVGIRENLGRTLDLKKDGQELTLTDESGNPVSLNHYFHQEKPVLLAFIYYECPMLCSLVLNGVLDAIKQMEWTVGQQYEIVTLSINPKDTPALAQQKKDNYIKRYNRPNASTGWHFLTGSEAAVRAIADQIGFDYRYDPVEKQYLHAAGIFILTAQGKISRYLYGTSFRPQDLKLGLLEAQSGKIAPSTLDRVLLFCFHFDPSKNSYTLRMWRIVQVVLTVQAVILAGLLAYLWKRDKSAKA